MAAKATRGGAHLVEAARATALAAHAAAGLAAAAKHSCAARLLRSAEAVARAAVAALLDAASRPEETALPAATPPRRPDSQKAKRKKKPKDKKKAGEEEGSGTVAASATTGTISSAPPALDSAAASLCGAAITMLGDVDAYMEGSEIRVLMAEDVQVPRAASSACSEAAQPTILEAENENKKVQEASAATSTASWQCRQRRRYFCTCKYWEPLSSKRKCKGCGWVYTPKQIAQLKYDDVVKDDG